MCQVFVKLLSPSAFFWKARVHKRAPVGVHFCTPAARRMVWGSRLEDGIIVGGDGATGREGHGMGRERLCGGCGHEERTLGVEQIVAGERGLTMPSGRIRT